MEQSEIKKCKKLLDDFISGRISASEFEKEYMALWIYWRDNKITGVGVVEEVLDTLFSDCDVYCPDPKLRDKNDIDDKQLLEFAKISRKKLELIS